jgi:hypothetical protein
MNSARTSLIRYCDTDSHKRLDSKVDELVPSSFLAIRMKAFNVADRSRLRDIGKFPFPYCALLGSIGIPSSVKVVGVRVLTGWELVFRRFVLRLATAAHRLEHIREVFFC